MEQEYELSLTGAELGVIGIAMAQFCRFMIENGDLVDAQTERELSDATGSLLQKVAASQGVALPNLG